MNQGAELLAIQCLIIFLIKSSFLNLSQLKYALDDFLEFVKEENSIILTEHAILEIEKIRRNPNYLKKSYMFELIEPFLLPFYERNSTHF